jgi:hypothetical protein
MFATNETFFVITRILKNKMHFCVLHVGLRDRAPIFKYTATINQQDVSVNVSIRATTKPYLNNAEKILKKGLCCLRKRLLEEGP